MVSKHEDPQLLELDRLIRSAPQLQNRNGVAVVLLDPDKFLAALRSGSMRAQLGQETSSGLTAREVILLEDRVVRNASTVYPVRLMDMRGSSERSFEVENLHDQAVTVHLIAARVNREQAGDVGESATIAANTIETVHTDKWANWMGLRAVYAADPTSGTLKITGMGHFFS